MPDFAALDGILVLDKPVGISSNQALQKAKRLLAAKKAGHGGTLDVLASGMLVLYFGKATKFAQQGLDADKVYLVAATLGIRTTTCDAEGEVVETKPVEVTDSELQAALARFRGRISQVPSMYSALKYQGKPLYEYARQGIEVPRAAREVEIHELNCLAFEKDSLTLKVRCSKGTYIRNLVDDLGQVLGCGAYVTALRRLSSGKFQESEMMSLETLESLELEARRAWLIPL